MIMRTTLARQMPSWDYMLIPTLAIHKNGENTGRVSLAIGRSWSPFNGRMSVAIAA